MQIKEIYKLQKELDEIIVKNVNVRNNYSIEIITQKDFLTERLLALMVEVSELANETRSFKYWSTKESEPKEKVLGEFADVLHFVFSVANSLDFTAKEIEQAYLKKYKENLRRQENGY